MSETATFPWSFYSILIMFAIFFFSLNVYIATELLSHPWRSPFWILGIIIGFIGLIWSYKWVRIHQAELVEKKRQAEMEEKSEGAE